MEGQQKITQIKYQWMAVFTIQGVALSLCIAIFSGSLASYFFISSFWFYALVFLMSITLFLLKSPLLGLSNQKVARYLDLHFPELEDSSSLLLKPADELTLLERLQVDKIQNSFPEKHLLKGSSKKMFMAALFLIAGVASHFIFVHLKANTSSTEAQTVETRKLQDAAPEMVLPQISNYAIIITPPAYTSKASSVQKQFYIRAELDAKVSWKIKTNKSVQSFLVIFNDKEIIKLSSKKGDATLWNFTRNITKQGFYQFELDGVKSDLYAIDVIPDLPVTIKVMQPKPQTTIDIGQTKSIDIKTVLTDDYGISEAHISATMASGKGESVSFTEKTLAFNFNFKNQRKATLSKHINLTTLGMKLGDELYFFIHAKDNRGQLSRSDTYSVTLVDTAELMSMAGMTSGVNLVPEYFRSQRQIILDTEKLLTEKSNLTREEYNKRANNLGVDQKLLRLRYGQFLGEENETEIGGDHHKNDGHGHAAAEEKFGDVQAIMDKYAHKHDIAEDATFFEPETKAQLKAVLNEMWKAELQLRIYKLEEALPFEYKALRLLKDLQQKSRAYVAKTTVKTSALKLEKRLTGELDKITNPTLNSTYEIKNTTKDELKVLLAVLDLHRNGKPFSENEKALLQASEKHLVAAAGRKPASFLSALKSLRSLNSQTIPSGKDLDNLANAIYSIIGSSNAKPKAATKNVDKKLADTYFKQLKTIN